MQLHHARITRLAPLIIATCAMLWGSASAQEAASNTKVGISAVVQSAQLDVLLPIWMSDQFVLVPSLGFVGVSDSYTDIVVGLAFRFNARRHDANAVPYGGGRVVLLQYSPEGPADGATDFIFGPFVGGEYFLDDHFSLGVEAQLNVGKSDENSLRFGNPDGTSINTATAVMATFYF